MAGIELIATQPDITSGVSIKTLIHLLAAAQHRIKIKGWGVFCKGIVTTDAPLLVQLIRQSTAGTMSALTLVKKDTSVAETLQTTATHTATVEPGVTNILKSIDVHPQSGFSEFFPLGSELIVVGGGRMGIAVTAGVSISVSAFFDFEE